MTAGEERRFILSAEKLTGEAINRWGLIAAGDKVAVGLSGGKDSFALLDILANRRRRLPITYELFAVHVDFSDVPYKIDTDAAADFCSKLNVPFTVIQSTAGISPEYQPCLTCSKRRRSELFEFCRRTNCTSLALGHHKDDIIETMLLNLIFDGSISSMPPKLPLFGGKLNLIRPLALMSEQTLREYAALRRFPRQLQNCPHEDKSRRKDAKLLVAQMEKMNPLARTSIFNALGNIKQEYLPSGADCR